MSTAVVSLIFAFILQIGGFIWKFSKADSRIESLEKQMLDIHDLKVSLNEINLNLMLLNQSVHVIGGKKLEEHEKLIKELEKEVRDLKFNLK